MRLKPATHLLSDESLAADNGACLGGLARGCSALGGAEAQAVPHCGQVAATAPAVQLERLQRLCPACENAEDGAHLSANMLAESSCGI